jgi:hypothetical protein
MSSFTLPSHAGVVSLLNDVRPTKTDNLSTIQTRPALLERHSSGSSSAFSTISNDPNILDSLSSAPTSINSTLGTSSSIGSLEDGKIAEIHALRSKLKGQTIHSEDNFKKRDASEGRDSSNDEDAMPMKRRRSKEILGRPVNSRSRSSNNQQDKILDHVRLASSPKPLQNGHDFSEDAKDVPFSMHKATSMSEQDNDLQGKPSSKPVTDTLSGDTTETNEMSSKPSGKRRYPCSFPNCDKTFSTSGHAARHNRIHTGSKPYRCTFPGCNASFSRQDNSLQHYRTHVLHPKNRSNGVNGLIDRATSTGGEHSASSSSSADGHHGLDAETQASVRMGRKALEEGTAIAVVHEIVDGNGRRGEAVHRMVGQPKVVVRRESNTTSASQFNERKDQDVSMHSIKPGEATSIDDDDSMSVGTSRSYSNKQSTAAAAAAYSLHQPPAAFSHDEHPGYSAHQSSKYPPTASPSSRTGGPYSSGPHYRMQSYQTGSSSNYFSTHDYFPSTQYQQSRIQLDQVRRSSANNLSYLPPPPPYQADAANKSAATIDAHRFYSATSSPLHHNPRIDSINAADHRRVRSFGNAQISRPTHLEDQRQMGERKFHSTSPPEISSNLAMLSSSAVNDQNTLPSIDNATFQNMRPRTGADQMRLLPSVSKVPYSSDRSTSDHMPTTPLDDLYMHKHGIRDYDQDVGRTLAPLRSTALSAIRR